MIGYIRGTLSQYIDGGIIVESTSGIGFIILIPMNSPLYKYSESDEIKVFTQMIVKEDDISLFGFHNRETLDMFKLLTTVNGIGPKGAMAIIGSMGLEELIRAIAFEDIKSISGANGVGKKTAERLILELKDKVGDLGVVSDINHCVETTINDTRTEAINALVALGYTKQEAFGAVGRVSEENLTSEEYIKKALKNLF